MNVILGPDSPHGSGFRRLWVESQVYCTADLKRVAGAGDSSTVRKLVPEERTVRLQRLRDKYP
eukprot:5617448-Amphidinium_carterae.1